VTDATAPFLRYDQSIVDKDGKPVQWFVDLMNNLTSRTGGEFQNALLGVINGNQTQLDSLQAQIDAANAAAQAAIAASGSTTTGQDADGFNVTSETFATVLSVPLTHAGGGNYDITAVITIPELTTTALVTGDGSSSGDWQILEDASVLASGTFTATSTFAGSELGTNYYTNTITFDAGFPDAETTYADVGSGAVTIALQLRLDAGQDSINSLNGSLLVIWV